MSKDAFLNSLDSQSTLNDGTKARTALLNGLIASKEEVDIEEILRSVDTEKEQDKVRNLSASNPGSLESILPVAPGTWKVVYAPHMSTIRNLVAGGGKEGGGGGMLDVTYILHKDQTIESHAKFAGFPLLPNKVHLSVSGTYDTVNDCVCRVEWSDAWIRVVDESEQDESYPQISSVPDSAWKTVITRIGRLLFIRPFSVFPVSFLDHDLTVFDFELLGTRICARKVAEP